MLLFEGIFVVVMGIFFIIAGVINWNWLIKSSNWDQWPFKGLSISDRKFSIWAAGLLFLILGIVLILTASFNK
jgi:hypothetical protein